MKLLFIFLSAALARGCASSIDNSASSIGRHADNGFNNNLAGQIARGTGRAISRQEINDSTLRVKMEDGSYQSLDQFKETYNKLKTEELVVKDLERNLVKLRASHRDVDFEVKEDLLMTTYNLYMSTVYSAETKEKCKNLIQKELDYIKKVKRNTEKVQFLKLKDNQEDSPLTEQGKGQ